jgi:hypothetical protein
MNQSWKAFGANPNAFTFFSAWQHGNFILVAPAVETNLGNVFAGGLCQVFFHRLFIKVGRFPGFYGQSALRAGPDAKTGSVAKFLSNYPGFTVFNHYSTLSARADTKAAAVALFLIYFNNLSFSHFNHLVIIIVNTNIHNYAPF